MDILLPEDGFWKTLNKNSMLIPLALVDGASSLYFLISDIHEDLENFILTGKAESTEYHVFTEERERELIEGWSRLGLCAIYRSQQIEYMGHNRITINYLQVHNPGKDIKISLIPWFILPGRPYPVFLYIYSIWHYQETGLNSLSKSAAAGGKLFGISKLNKSTVSRSIKAMEGFIDISRIDRPLSTDGREVPCGEEIFELVVEILENCPTLDSLEKELRGMVKHLPPPIKRAEAARLALSGIPAMYAKIIKGRAPCATGHDARKRPARPKRKKKPADPQNNFTFVAPWQITQIRKAFIEACRHLVLDAAVTYHRFLVQ